ncbi:MAG: hypothetical protein ACI9C1_002649 [Candidatus Aldehydirespiratoraceae bacterium]
MQILPERRRSWSLGYQFSALVPLLLIWTFTSVLLYASAAQDKVPTERLFLDPATLSGEPWYTGLLHELGVLGWTVAATSAAAGAWVAAQSNRPRAVWFMAGGSVVTLLLLGDDITGFHSDVGIRLGIPKMASIAGLLGISGLWFVINWREIRRTRWLTLIASLAAFALSVLFDYERRDTSFNVFFEDAPKLLGIVGWATYFVLTAVDITRAIVRSRDGAAAA